MWLRPKGIKMGFFDFIKRKKDRTKSVCIRPTIVQREYHPEVYILKKSLPGIDKGARFQQSFPSDGKIYFHGIPILSDIPESQQVGIIEFEAQYIENSPEWFVKLTAI